MVTHDGKPWFAVEAKLTDTTISPALLHFQHTLKIPWAYQVVLEGNRDFIQDGVRCLPAHRFVSALV